MNKLKRLFITMTAFIIACVCMLGLMACSKEDIVKAKFNIEIYNYTDSEMDSFTLDVDLYRHLAPKTVNAISKYIKDGYYDNTVFYKLDEHSKQFMIGDLKYDPELQENEGFYLNEEMPTVEGEFKHGGTTGSNLKHNNGTVGLWRTWAAQDVSYNMGRTGTDSGRATLFMPTARMQAYDDYFCVFGVYDVEDTENKKTVLALTSTFSNENYKEFVIYYTREADGSLAFHCVNADNFFKDDIENLYEAKAGSAELACYNYYTIQVPMNAQGQVAALIKSAKIK